MNATITAAEINKLRQITGAGMMDCRKALTETGGDFDAAIDWLRKQGQKVAAKRQDREAKEGVVIARTNPTQTSAFVLCLACETDFVAKNSEFVAFAQSLIDIAVDKDLKNLDELNAAPYGNITVSEKINEQVGKVGEKIGITRFERIDATGVATYIHGTYRMGVIVGLNKHSEADISAGKDMAMQIAAMNPVAIDQASVPASVVEREKAIVLDLIKQDPKMAGKSDDMLEKIISGKLNSFFKESTLLAQPFVKDSNHTVADYLKSVDPALKITDFKRVALG
jgi:elongation factor Ts